MKKVLLICLVAAMLLSVCSCGNRAYLNLIEEKTNDDIPYVGIRDNLTIVSNVYEEVDLKKLGLMPSAYFICGTDEYMYFCEKRVSSDCEVVMEYSLKDNTLNECARFDLSHKIASVDGKTFYCFETERTLTFLGYRYTWRVYRQEKDSKDSELLYEQGSNYDSLNSTEGEKFIDNFMEDIAQYAWVDNPVYMKNGEERVRPQPHNTKDAVMNMVTEEGGVINFYYTPTSEGKAVVRVNYEDHDNFFLYTYNGDFEFMFADEVPKKDANRIIAIYTVNPQY